MKMLLTGLGRSALEETVPEAGNNEWVIWNFYIFYFVTPNSKSGLLFEVKFICVGLLLR